MIEIVIAIGVACTFISTLSLFWSAYCWSELRGLKESTHRVSYVDPFNKQDAEGFSLIDEETEDELTKDSMENVQ